MLEWFRRLRHTLWLPLFAALCLGMAPSAYSAPKKILVVGDSLSAEYGLAAGTGWVALLGEKLKQQKLEADIVNASVSGETTSGGRTRLPALLKKHNPDIVIIELGANDGLRGLPVAAAESNLRAMVKQSQAAGAKVLLVGMRMPPNYGRDYADKFFAMFGSLSREVKAPLAPFMLDGVADKNDLFQPDRLHPLAKAHPIILGNIWPHLQPLLKSK
jgi:acyl-CoA thioesterase-1